MGQKKIPSAKARTSRGKENNILGVPSEGQKGCLFNSKAQEAITSQQPKLGRQKGQHLKSRRPETGPDQVTLGGNQFKKRTIERSIPEVLRQGLQGHDTVAEEVSHDTHQEYVETVVEPGIERHPAETSQKTYLPKRPLTKRLRTVRTTPWTPRIPLERMPRLEVPFTENSNISTPEGDPIRKKVRGPNTGNGIDPPPGRRWVVEFNERNQAVGDSAGYLCIKLGLYARLGNYFPLDITDWRKVSQTSKEDVFLLVEEHFDFQDHPKAQKFVFTSLNTKWKYFKSEMKHEHFDPHANIADPRLRTEVRINDCPWRVDRRQWERLVKFWESPEGEALCERNKLNCANVRLRHRTGTLGIARLGHKMAEKAGTPQEFTDVWIQAFGGDDINTAPPESARLVVEVKDLHQAGYSKNCTYGVDDPVTVVCGKENGSYMRGLGFGCGKKDFLNPVEVQTGKSVKMLVETNVELRKNCNMMSKKFFRQDRRLKKLMEKMNVNDSENSSSDDED